MTGPEHYRDAETLIRKANSITDGFPGEEYAQTLAEAQVHATLALAAAHLAGVLMHPADRAEWDRATGRTGETT